MLRSEPRLVLGATVDRRRVGIGNAAKMLGMISDVLVVTDSLGFSNVKPVVLGNAGNLLVYLSPFPIVARVAKLFADDDSMLWREIWDYEIKVARHLMESGIPVVSYSRVVPPGPYPVGATWMTLWEYAELVPIPALSAQQAITMVNHLAIAMSKFQEPLPPLGAWRNVAQAADYLSHRDDGRISTLLMVYKKVNERIHREVLYPAHGDAHQGNLLATGTGWRWIDFEDVSLMPKFWDLASFIGNTVLFHGLKQPIVQAVLRKPEVSQDRPAFQFALAARVIMSTMTNLALALNGHGDGDFAQAQIERIHDFLWVVDQGL